jgi:hypothetical protein
VKAFRPSTGSVSHASATVPSRTEEIAWRLATVVMNKKRLALGAALLSVATLTSMVPSAARADGSGALFSVDFRTKIAWYGKVSRTRITAEIHNNSGHAVDHLRLVVDGLNGKGHVVSRVYRSVDATIPAGGQLAFEAEIPSAPSYRVYVDHFEALQAP